MSPTTRVRVAGGISLLDEGEGPAVLLLHGIGGSAGSCAAAAALLAREGRRALVWDAPGYGESADPDGPVDWPARVLQVLDELGLDQVDLFGTSWGGVIATVVAAQHPERVRTLVLADATRGSGITPERAAAMRARVTELAERGAEATAAARAPRLVAPGGDPAVLDLVRGEMARVRLPGFRAAADFMAGTDTADLLPGIACPTLVLVGEHDAITGVPESELLARTIPGARLRIVPDAGHVAVTERPAEVVAAMREFWAAA